MTPKVTAVTLTVLRAADLEVVGGQRCRTGDVGLDPGRWRGVGDDRADGVDRFVGQSPRPDCPAGTAAPERPCRPCSASRRRGQRIAPEVLDVLDVGGVGGQLLAPGCRRTGGRRRPGADRLPGRSSRAVGVELAEDLADVLHRLQRRRIRRALRHRMCSRRRPPIVGRRTFVSAAMATQSSRWARRIGGCMRATREPCRTGSSTRCSLMRTCPGRRCSRSRWWWTFRP